MTYVCHECGVIMYLAKEKRPSTAYKSMHAIILLKMYFNILKTFEESHFASNSVNVKVAKRLFFDVHNFRMKKNNPGRWSTLVCC